MTTEHPIGAAQIRKIYLGLVIMIGLSALDQSIVSTALPRIVDAVGGRMPVLVDGGFRRGGDVAKALALGAQAVLLGRPPVYGLACDGQQGVAAVLALLRQELERTMVLLGAARVGDIDRHHVMDPH